MHPYVPCRAMYDSQDMDATKMPVNRWMKKEDVVHIYNGVLHSHKKEWKMPSTVTWKYLEMIIFSVVSQTEKDTYNMISLKGGV